MNFEIVKDTKPKHLEFDDVKVGGLFVFINNSDHLCLKVDRKNYFSFVCEESFMFDRNYERQVLLCELVSPMKVKILR